MSRISITPTTLSFLALIRVPPHKAVKSAGPVEFFTNKGVHVNFGPYRVRINCQLFIGMYLRIWLHLIAIQPIVQICSNETEKMTKDFAISDNIRRLQLGIITVGNVLSSERNTFSNALWTGSRNGIAELFRHFRNRFLHGFVRYSVTHKY